MFTTYVRAAMRRAEYEWMEEEQSFYARIPDCPGVWASGRTQDVCAKELQEVLEEWLKLGLRLGHPIPKIDGIDVQPDKTVPVDG